MDNKIEYSKPVPPFVKFCAANIPMVFDDSLSYYECLCALWKWLQTDVIDVINNNAQVTQVWRQELTTFENNVSDEIENFETEMRSDFSDLNEAFETLKSWIDNYFDNLDVQEEINNKLDAMVEDGTLQEIITTYIQSNVTWTFDNVADMKSSTNLINGSYARTLGFNNKNDGGGALYYIDDNGVADEKSTIAITDTLNAHIVPDENINIRQFGAFGDDIHDDTQSIQAAINYSQSNKLPLEIPNGTYLVSSVEVTEKIKIYGCGHDSIIKSIDNNPESVILHILNNGVYKSEFSDFRIEGNKDNNSSDIDGFKLHINSEGETKDQYTFVHNITINKCTGNGFVTQGDLTNYDIREIRIENLNIQDCKNGLYVRSCTDSFFSFLTVNTCKQYGFDIAGGPHKFVSCKSFYNGKGDETTIEDIDRLPTNAFSETSDSYYNPNKTYYTRSGKGINNDWYVFAEFTGSEFLPDTTYYEMVKSYYKRYAGFIFRGSVIQMVNCEAQENYGDGIVLLGNENSLSNISVDNNGFQPATYASLGYYTLYYGIYCKGNNSIISGVGRNLRVSEYGNQQRSVLMINGVGYIDANLTASAQVVDYICTENALLNTLHLVYKGSSVGFQCSTTDLTEKSENLTFASGRNNITLKDGVVYMNLVVNDTAGFATNTTEKTIFKLPEIYRPNGSVICEAYLSTADGWAINDKICQIAVYSSGSVKTRARNSSETSNATTLIAEISYPVNISYI